MNKRNSFVNPYAPMKENSSRYNERDHERVKQRDMYERQPRRSGGYNRNAFKRGEDY